MSTDAQQTVSNYLLCYVCFCSGGSLEVTRTISNNKLNFTRECSILLEREKGPETGFPFFFLMIPTFFKNILILIITSLAIHYSQNVFRGYSILVCIGVQVFF